MGFGILPVEKRLGLEQDFRIGDLEDILATMRRLDVSPTGGGVQELLRLAQVHPGENAGFSHLIGIVALIRLLGLTATSNGLSRGPLISFDLYVMRSRRCVNSGLTIGKCHSG